MGGGWQARKEAAAIRNIIVEDRRLIFDAKDVLDPEDLSVRLARVDEWRAVLYNKMLGEVGRILDHWSPHFPQERKQSLLRALDWYHREGVIVAPGPRVVGHKFPQIEAGTWPGDEMSLDEAKERFGKLEVGEIGLDGAPEYRRHWQDQRRVFRRVLELCTDAGGRIMTIHSRRAATAVLDDLGACAAEKSARRS